MAEALNIHDNKASDVVKGFAKSMGTTYEQNHHEYCVKIPEKFGSGYIKAFEFDFGMGAIEWDFYLKESFSFEYEKGILFPLKFIFNRQSHFQHNFTEDEDLVTVNKFENIIVASTAKSNHIFTVPAETSICVFSLEVNRKLFEEKIESFLQEMDEDLITMFRDVNGVNQFFYKSNFSLEISKFIEEFTECELDGFMKQVYLEGKAYEIFVQQLKQYLDDLNEPDQRKILRQSTIENIEQAATIIHEEIDAIINVVNLAQRVGLNPNTLQNGFQAIYGVSVNEYVRNHRVDTAKKLIETTDLNITQITYQVGINSRSYFSKLFKKRFGMTPKSYSEKVKKGSKKPKSA